METVLIADDEKNIREGIKCIIDWEELGFKVCGEAANGEEALKQIYELHPSLVLLDIKMPKLTGIFHGIYKRIFISRKQRIGIHKTAYSNGYRQYSHHKADEWIAFKLFKKLKIKIYRISYQQI